MPDVKWIKVATDIFSDNRKIKSIEGMPKGDTIIVIWFKLLVLAGIINDGGMIYITPNNPYTEKSLASELKRPLKTVKAALEVFETLEMIKNEGGYIHLLSWNEYQNIEALAEIREYNRLAQQRSRARRKESKNVNDNSCSVNDNVNDERYKMSLTCQEEKNEEKSTKREDKKEDALDIEAVDAKNLTFASADKDQLKLVGGTLAKGVVYLTDRQREDLLEKLGLDAFNRYVDKIASYIIKNNACIKNHYETILKWYAEDSQVSNKSIKKSKERYGDFDAEEAFKLALERSFVDVKQEDI